MNAATSGSIDTVQAILHFKPELEIKDGLGWTALIIAGKVSSAYHNCPRLTFQYAASAGNREVCSEIIGAGANVSAENDKGGTALHYAAR